jgi:hypothetical protein
MIMAEKPAFDAVREDGIFTVKRLLPVTDEAGDIRISSCECGCTGTVTVIIAIPKTDSSETSVLTLDSAG